MWPSRTEPIGPWNGSGERPSAADGAVHRQHVAVVLPVAGQHEALDLHFVVEARRETAAGSAGPSAGR